MTKKTKQHICKVSIGMPVYNGEEFIGEALDSLLAQTFAKLEIIISDNSSTDCTESICREYAARDPRIRYVRQSENRGAIANFQFVLNEANGEYFMWAAADDVWDVRYVETLLPVSSSYQCLAYGFVHTIDAAGQKTMHPANRRRLEYRGYRHTRRLKYYMEPGVLGKANPIFGIFPTIKLRSLDLSSFESEKSGGDMLLLYDLLDYIEIRHAGEVILYKRVHAGNLGAIREIEKRTFIARLSNLIKEIIVSPMLVKYIRRSNFILSMFLVAAYPVCLVHNAVYMLQSLVSLNKHKPLFKKTNT